MVVPAAGCCVRRWGGNLLSAKGRGDIDSIVHTLTDYPPAPLGHTFTTN